MSSVLTMPLLDAREMAAALVPHASKDDVTPVLKVIAVGGRKGSFAYATDRYTVGRYDLTNIVETMPEENVLIPASALSAVRMLGHATLPGHSLSEYAVEFERTSRPKSLEVLTAKAIWHPDPNSPAEVQWMRTWFLQTRSDTIYPPVEKLFNDFVRGPQSRTHLSGEQLGKFAGYSKYLNDAMRVTLPVGEKSPILIEIGTRFKGLLMPSVVSSTWPSFGNDLAEENSKREENASGTSG